MTVKHIAHLEGSLACVAICGGIAAYKSVDVVSRLRKAGLDVRVAMTEAAQQFVTPLTFAAVSGHPVVARMFVDASAASGDALYPHLYPSTRADLFVVTPATADMIAKLVHGIADDVVSTAALSLPATCRRFFCPAMNVEMWHQPVVQENVAALEARGWRRIGPDAGILACGMEGDGRMSEPAEIVDRILGTLRSELTLAGRKVLILSGPTHEHFDPVRFIGNASSGRMGRALAEAALAAGANVEFVTGPVADAALPQGAGLRLTKITSAKELLAAGQARFGSADIVIYAAAVADYAPREVADKKLPKQGGDVVLHLQATPDVAATLNQGKRPGQVVIGFALQTHDGVAKARAKLAGKGLDGIVLNALDAMGGDTGTYTYLTPSGDAADWGKLDKRACARLILAEAAKALQGATRSALA
jgi:phosphopantothenoylcysteine decarboxylase/phosphopantothenate--cysteine ligase